MKRTLILILFAATTLLMSSFKPPRPVTDPVITYTNLTGSNANPADPNDPWTIEMYVEIDHSVPYQQIVQFQILKWQQFGYGFPRQYTWGWVWNTYTVTIPANSTWGVLFDTFKVGETYDYFNYNVIGPTKFP